MPEKTWLRNLVLAAPLLMAASPPPNPCTQAAELPMPVDLSGRPVPATPLVSAATLVQPDSDAAATCATPPRQTDALQDPRADALHALPTPDVTAVSPVSGEEN